jgi:thymidylate synthase
MTNFDKIYKELYKDIITKGIYINSRNGVTKQIPFAAMHINVLNSNVIPVEGVDAVIYKDMMLTMRKMFIKGVIGEFKTLIDVDNPLTNVSQFRANGCNYWDAWAGPNGELNLDYYNKLHPALDDTINEMVANPYSRRLLINLWDNCKTNRDKLSLPCCWYGLQFIVEPSQKFNGYNVTLVWSQRSVDFAVGLPSDAILASLFLSYVINKASKKSNKTFNANNIVFSLANVHIYQEHIDKLDQMFKNPNKNAKIKFELKE